MEVLSAIKDMRLVEKFNGKDIPIQTILEILDTARWSISFQGMQSWEVIFIKTEDRKTELAEILAKGELKRAASMLVICSNEDRARFVAGEEGELKSKMEVSAFIQSIVTASRGFGISCNLIVDFNKETLQKFVDTPKGVKPIAVLSLGFTTQQPQIKRVPITTFVHTEKFGNPWKGALPSKFSKKSNKGTFMHIFG